MENTNFFAQFENLDGNLKLQIVSLFKPVVFEKHEYLLKKDDISQKIFFIESGVVAEIKYVDGNADIVMANYAAMINSVGTLSCWFKIGQIGKRNFIYITDPGLTNEHFALSWYKYADRLEGDVKYNSQCKPGKGWIKAFTAQSYQDDKWHNVAVTWGDGDVKVYVDNVLAATAVTPVNNADACAGGILIINPIGKVDDLSIYNRIITAEERAMLYDAESPRIMSVVKH
jgi:hypothetical protein